MTERTLQEMYLHLQDRESIAFFLPILLISFHVLERLLFAQNRQPVFKHTCVFCHPYGTHKQGLVLKPYTSEISIHVQTTFIGSPQNRVYLHSMQRRTLTHCNLHSMQRCMLTHCNVHVLGTSL